jgi:hypothetical protein
LKPVFLFCLMPTKLEAIFVEATPSGISEANPGNAKLV